MPEPKSESLFAMLLGAMTESARTESAGMSRRSGVSVQKRTLRVECGCKRIRFCLVYTVKPTTTLVASLRCQSHSKCHAVDYECKLSRFHEQAARPQTSIRVHERFE